MGRSLSSGLGDGVHHFGSRVGARVEVDYDLGSAPAELLGDRPADAAGGAGHYSHLAVELHLEVPSAERIIPFDILAMCGLISALALRSAAGRRTHLVFRRWTYG